MKITMRTIINAVCRRRVVSYVSLAMLALMGPALWAAGKSDKIETVTAEGGEIWENDFDVRARKKGQYNYIVYARDRAGNEAISGPFNVRIDPNAGLPTARVIYPAANAIIRQNINLLGVASGRYGVERVMARLDGGEFAEVTGKEYWNQYIDFSVIPDGKHTLYVQVFDALGAAGPVESVNFILDTTPPQIELTSHEIGDIVTGSITLRGEARDPNGIKTMEYSEDGVKFLAMAGKKRGINFEFALPINTKKIEDGPLVYYLRAVDTTGMTTVKPCLLFVTNSGPELELYSPEQGEDVYGVFYLSGRAFDKIGLSRVYYEWGKIKEDIEMRPGDPYWNVKLDFVKGSAGSIKVSAVDKVGNVTSVTRKMEDKRKIKVPVLVIDYPSEDALKAMQKGMPADTAIYGHIAPGADPKLVTLEKYGEVEALSGFRIAPHMIPYGKTAQTLKLTPVDTGAVKGTAISLRYLKQQPLAMDESEINVTAPARNSWHSGNTLLLQGTVANPQNVEVQFRLNPQDSWRPARMDLDGNFSSEVSMDGRPQGVVHLELRSVRRGEELYPMYHPFSWAASQPEIKFLSPTEEHSLVWGSKTVMGHVEHSVPISAVAYSLDRRNFEDIPFVSRMGEAWFGYFCNFNELRLSARGGLAFRITDASGASFYEIPQYEIEPNPPLPVIIVNSPVDDEVLTDAFEISGLAYDEVGIESVHYRILGPKMESLSTGPAGEEARRLAAVYEANPDISFKELYTEQNFSIPIDFSMITDGEYIVEIYASNPYGVHSETVERTIKISTLPPETRIMSPVITRYNQKAILVRGFSSDANIVDSVTLSMDNGNTWQEVVLQSDGRWEIALNTAAYTDGIYSALVETKDKYGIASLANAMVNIDNTPPELYLTSPVDGQHVGTNVPLVGRVQDMTLKSLTFQIISADNPTYRKTLEAEPRLVVFETLSLEGFPQGEYIIRVVAKDLADNETLISRKIVYDADDKAAEIAIYNPLPGEVHSGPIHIVGIVTGSFLPEEVQLMMNNQPLERVPVERYGIFRYEIPESMLPEEGAYGISAFYNSETNKRISSPSYTVYYSPYGPILQVDSHQDGVVITGRPYLKGHAWYNVPEPGEDEEPLSRREKTQQRSENAVKNIMVSHDNGRSFQSAKGTDEWQFRLETSLLPRGPQPIVVRAQFANGEEAVRRLMVYVDTTIPQVETVSPPEDSVHRENIQIYGTAGDNYELANVDVSLRPYDKFFYSVPGAIQGLYFDVKGFGATYFDVGLGLSLFDDNVRLQLQFGITPADETQVDNLVEGGRYVGYAYGIKLLANIFYLPFDYLFGLDWAFYSMNFAIGANFSYFTMDEWRQNPNGPPGLFMGAVVAQWDIANINMQYFYPNWKYFRKFALYLEPELWFTSTDVDYDDRRASGGERTPVSKIKFRMTIGLRLNWF